MTTIAAIDSVASAPAKPRKQRRHAHSAANVFKRGNRFYYNIVVNGKKVRQSLGKGITSRNQAIEAAAKLTKDAAEERFDRIFEVRVASDEATLKAIIQAYLAADDLPCQPHIRKINSERLLSMVAIVLDISKEQAAEQSVRILDGEFVRKYQKLVLGRADPKDPEAVNSAKVTANCGHRMARSLFSRAALRRHVYKGLGIERGLALGETKTNWVGHLQEFCEFPTLDEWVVDEYEMPAPELVNKIWQAAVDELVKVDPKCFMIFWLASQVGLRRREICAAQWSWLGDHQIRVVRGPSFVAKNKKARVIETVPATRAVALSVARSCSWDTSPNAKILPGATKLQRRTFERFCKWMISLGWTRREKAHELRKIFASQLCAKAGEYAAQVALGHGQLETTMIYAARPKTGAVDPSANILGHALAPEFAAVPAEPDFCI